jgi:hypothetical protein
LIFSTIFAIILGFNSLLYWKKTEVEVFFKKLLLPLIISTGGAVLLFIAGYGKIIETWSTDQAGVSLRVVFILIVYLLFFFASLFALVTNLIYIVRRKGGTLWTLGGYLSHIGFAILLLGIIISSTYGTKSKVNLTEGKNGTALGYDIKFTGNQTITAKEERSNFDVSKGGEKFTAYSTSKQMDRGGEQGQYVRTPFIKKYLFSDLYISLENMTDGSQIDMRPFTLGMGQSIDEAGYKFTFTGFDSPENKAKMAGSQPKVFDIAKNGTFEIDGRKITFRKFDMGQHEQGNTSSIGAILDVEFDGKTTQVIPTYVPIAAGEHNSPAVDLPGGGSIALEAIKADVGSVSLAYSPSKGTSGVKLGTALEIGTAEGTMKAMPIYDPATAHGEQSIVPLPDGGHLFLISVDAKSDSASYVLVPAEAGTMATIEVSTKPMINLVWFGFLIIVLGSGLAVVRRMRESKQLKDSLQEI